MGGLGHLIPREIRGLREWPRPPGKVAWPPYELAPPPPKTTAAGGVSGPIRADRAGESVKIRTTAVFFSVSLELKMLGWFELF